MRRIDPSSKHTENAIRAIRKRMFLRPASFAARVGWSTANVRLVEAGRLHAPLAILEEIHGLALQFGLRGSAEMHALDNYYKARMRTEILSRAIILQNEGRDITANNLAQSLYCSMLHRWRHEPCVPSGEPESLWKSRFQQIEFLKRLLELRSEGYLSFADIKLYRNVAPLCCVDTIKLTDAGLFAVKQTSRPGDSLGATRAA